MKNDTWNMTSSLNKINSLIGHTVISLLKDISKEYDIPYEDLKNKYIPDLDEVLCGVHIPAKRGRKKKIKDDYIETEEFEFEGNTYLVDRNHIVYSSDVTNHVVLGQRLFDGTIKFL